MNPDGQYAGVDSQDFSNTETSTVQPDTTSVNNFTFSQLFGFFNILAGLMIVAAFLFFFGGLTAYLTRLGLDGRTQGLKYMYYGCTILFVLIVLLAIVHYVQFHPKVVFVVVGAAVVIFAAWVAYQVASQPAGEEEEH